MTKQLDDLQKRIGELKALVEKLSAAPSTPVAPAENIAGQQLPKLSPKEKDEGPGIYTASYYGVNGDQYHESVQAESKADAVRKFLNMKVMISAEYDENGLPYYPSVRRAAESKKRPTKTR